MKKIVTIFLLSCCLSAIGWGQQPTENRQQIRIVDTLTRQEKNTRVPVLLRSELDSMIAAHLASLPKEPVQEPVVEPQQDHLWLWAGAGGLVLLLLLVVILLQQQRKGARELADMREDWNKWSRQMLSGTSTTASKEKESGGKKKGAGTEADLKELRDQVTTLIKERDGMELMLDEYRQIKQEYEGLKQQMLDAYKVRFYPGFDKSASEADVLRQLVKTERSLAYYAYDTFLKPVLQLTDANKNHPARMTDADKQQISDYLLSLGLLYAEYLYLRISELSVGGKMVERIGGLSKSGGIDPALLKQMNLEHGSRALALRMALDSMGFQKLSYPVFDETNLNLS